MSGIINRSSTGGHYPNQSGHVLCYHSPNDLDLMKTIGTGTFGRVLLCKTKRPLNDVISAEYKQRHGINDSSNSSSKSSSDAAKLKSNSSSGSLSKSQGSSSKKASNKLLPHASNASNEGYFALKMLNIRQVIKLKQLQHVKNEKACLLELDHPFIVQLFWTYHDDTYLYMLLEYVSGGELFTYLRAAQKFENDKALFYTVEIVSALAHCHEKDIIYRDMKPENVLLDVTGHIKLTDFGFAKKVKDRTWTLCGTPEYLAPEIIQSKGHGKAVDWWSLGILVYEMLASFPPFFDENPFDIYRKILDCKVEFPKHIHSDAKDLIRKLLVLDRTKRLGCLRRGTQDILEHKWFSTRGFTWNDVYRKKLRPPIVPIVSHAGDAQNFEDYDDSEESFNNEVARKSEIAMFEDF